MKTELSCAQAEMLNGLRKRVSGMKRALILGIGGQDGSYLADILLEQGWEVHGLHRRSSVDNLVRIAHCRDRVTLHRGDLLDSASVGQAIVDSKPNVVFNMADQDDARWSHVTPKYSHDVTCGAVQKLLDQLRVLRHRNIKLFQPLSALMFDTRDGTPPYNERSLLRPASPYAVAKLGAWNWCRYYREHHGVPVTCGIMFNHDSPRRGDGYLLQRICRQARDSKGLGHPKEIGRPIVVGDPDALVDVGHAREYMEAVVKLVELGPDDWVVGTGKEYAVGYLAQCAASWAGCEVKVDPDYPRSTAKPLVAEASKLRAAIGWRPKLHGEALVKSILEGT